MNKLPAQHWQYNGLTFTVSLYVEGGMVVGITPTRTNGGIIVPPKKYLGDQMGGYIGRITGRQPCGGCRKVESLLNNADKLARTVMNRAGKVIPGKPWHRSGAPNGKSRGDA